MTNKLLNPRTAPMARQQRGGGGGGFYIKDVSQRRGCHKKCQDDEKELGAPRPGAMTQNLVIDQP